MDIAEFNQMVEKVADPNDKEICRAMAVLLLALEVGPFPERLAQETGYSESFVDAIAKHMQEADLWREDLVDDREWWDAQGNLRGVGLFAHALIALGRLKRQKTLRGILYIDPSTGEIAGEWQNPEARKSVN